MAQRDVLPRLVRLSSRPRWLVTGITRLHAWILRASHGRIRRSWMFALGRPVASLTTTGHRSGQRRSTAVAYFRDGEDIIVTAGFLGVEHDPNWVRNLEANPDATIVVEGRASRVRARRTTGEERERLWARWLDLQPASERFARIAGREIPVIRLTLIEHSVAS